MKNYPEKFGFEPDLRKCIGRTIERVEILKMEWGCIWNAAFAVRFTDGTRAFFAGHVGTGIMNPQLDGTTYGTAVSVETSHIFTKREYAEMLSAKQQREQRDRDARLWSEREQYERLAAKFAK